MMTGAAATQRKERSEASTVEARRERAPEAGPPGSRDQAAVNGAGFEEEAAKFVRPPAVSRTRPDRAEGDTPGGQTEEEAALLGQYNLYNG